MSVHIQGIVRRSVDELLKEASNPAALKKLHLLHSEKIHFVPANRVLGGVLQALNIKFGNFIDHDTGKFVDINRKFLKTYAGLINQLSIKDRNSLNPYIFYFNPKKRWGPIYTPSCNIFRGQQLFDTYFETSFSDVDRYLREIGEDEKVLELFDNLFKHVRYDL